MQALVVIVSVVLAVVILEGVSIALAGLSARLFATRVPNRREFLRDQSTKLARLASGESIRAKIHPILGWEYGTGEISEREHLNAQGLRAVREYSPAKDPLLPRIAVFGDSYAYCNEVGDAESWPGRIEAGWESEVLNYGVGGYGADQAFLRFSHQGAQLQPDVVILAFTTMMAARVVSRYRRFQDPGDGPWFKPRFVAEGDVLRLVAAPVASREDADRLLTDPAAVAQFGQHDFWYNPAVFEHKLYAWSATYRLLACALPGVWRRYFHPNRINKGETLNPESEAFRILALIFRDFAVAARARGAHPFALLLPTRSDVEWFTRRGQTSYETLRPRIEELGLPVIDAIQALTTSTAPANDLFAPGGHYSARGNAEVAMAVANALQLRPRSNASMIPSLERQ